MESNKMVKIASVVMLFTIVAASLVSGTYAKYISKASGTDTVVVAKWEIKAGAKDGEKVSIYNENGNAETITFDLFNTIKDTGKVKEDDVETGKIAPGTAGSFELVIQNESEVTAQYGVKYTVTNASNVPLEFSVDNGTTWTKTLADVTAGEATKITKGGSKSVIVDWKWDFTATEEGRDTNDTNLGHAALGDSAPSVTVKADLTVEQVD